MIPALKSFRPALVALAAGLCLTLPAFAQPGLGGPGGAPGLDASLARFFGDIKTFTAKADMKIDAQNPRDSMSMVMGFAMLDGRIRTEMDMTQVKSAQLSAEMLGPMKQMGMDRIVMLIDPGKKNNCLIYPGLKAYTEIPMPQEQAAKLDRNQKWDKTALGNETIDGHPCVKNKVTITEADGKKQEATVWNATDLKDFPVQLEMTQEGKKFTLLCKDIKLTAPDASLFTAPTDYTKYDNTQALMQNAMMRMLGGQK
ncbi:MAG: DUF4412 domain-containing protein [Verrucomicrobiota bacterium]